MTDFLDEFMDTQSTSVIKCSTEILKCSELPTQSKAKKLKTEESKFTPTVCFFDNPDEPPRQTMDFTIPLFSYLPDDWKTLIGEDELKKEYIQKLQITVDEDYKTFIIYPPREQVFTAMQKCSVNKTKVVILGLDPYITPNCANGMAFSVPRGVEFPKSLKNIFEEIVSDIGGKSPIHGDLSAWSQQGVLLLNSILTVRAGKTESHGTFGWKIFTDHIISKLSQTKDHLVFLLWGKVAQEKEKLIDLTKHTVLKCAHPSPLSYTKGFKGCKHFSKCNQDLIEHKLTSIKW